MFKGLFCVAAICLSAGSYFASAQASNSCTQNEPACVLEAAWGAALVLPDDKKARLQAAFLEIAVLSGDPSLAQVWADRFDTHIPKAVEKYPDFGWSVAEPVLQRSGVDGLIQQARLKQGDVSIGRADALLAAGKRLFPEAPADAMRINQAMLEMTQSANDFEKPALAHAAAELAMVRCDAERFERGVSMTDAQNNMRYAFWRARMQGGVSGLVDRVRNSAREDDTMHVRQSLDGYRAILELGYCSQ